MRICASKLIEHSRKIELPSQHARHPDALLEPPPLILLSRSEKSSLDSSCVKQQCTQSISELTTHSSQMAHAIRKRNRKSEPEGQMARSSRSIGPAMLSAAGAAIVLPWSLWECQRTVCACGRWSAPADGRHAATNTMNTSRWVPDSIPPVRTSGPGAP